MRERPDPNYVRYTRLTPRARMRALDLPAARRLLVSSVGHYVDHENLRTFATSPRGETHTRIFLILSGSGTIRVRDSSYYLTPGSAIVLPPLTYYFGQPGRAGWALWHCELVGTDVLDVFAGAGIDIDHPVVRPSDPHGLAALLGTIIDCYEIDYSPPRLLDAVAAAWTIVLRLCADRSLPAGTSPLDRAVDYLERHLGDEVRVPVLAAAVGLSTPRLQRIFHDAFGKGVLAYQIERRMERARRLLQQSPQPIARIAREVGYADPYYFSRHFRAMNGVSPSAFRRGSSPAWGPGDDGGPRIGREEVPMLEEEYNPRRRLPPHLRKTEPAPEPFSWEIRPATERDLPHLLEIYNHYVANSTVTFDEDPLTLKEMRAKFRHVHELAYPWLVAESPRGVILGYAFVSPWKPKAAYRFTVENSIYLGPASTGRGLGSALMKELLSRAKEAGVKEVIAVIADRGADASLAMHQRFGFTEIGHMGKVGFKFGRWLGTLLLQKSLK